jgi:hypothetical protein
MAVTHFQDLPLADRDRAWDGGAAEKRVGRRRRSPEPHGRAVALPALRAG